MNGDFERSGLYPLDVTWNPARETEWLIRDVRTLTNLPFPVGLIPDHLLCDPAYITLVAAAILKSPDFDERLGLATLLGCAHTEQAPGKVFWAGVHITKDDILTVQLEDGSVFVENIT